MRCVAFLAAWCGTVRRCASPHGNATRHFRCKETLSRVCGGGAAASGDDRCVMLMCPCSCWSRTRAWRCCEARPSKTSLDESTGDYSTRRCDTVRPNSRLNTLSLWCCEYHRAENNNLVCPAYIGGGTIKRCCDPSIRLSVLSVCPMILAQKI